MRIAIQPTYIHRVLTMVCLTLLTLCGAAVGEESRLSAEQSSRDPILVFPAAARMIRNLSPAMRGKLPQDSVLDRIMSYPPDSLWHPESDEVIPTGDGYETRWRSLDAAASEQPLPRSMIGGYLYVGFEQPAERVMMLSGSGVGLVFINGEPHAGDLYQKGIRQVPVKLRKGVNHVFMLVTAPKPRLQLSPSAADLSLSGNHVVSDLIEGSKQDFSWAGVGICNATDCMATGLRIRASRKEYAAIETPVIAIPPLTVLRVAYKIPGGTQPTKDPIPVKVELLASDSQTVKQSNELQLRAVDPFNPKEPYRQTFVSNIDGSVQYYAVKQAMPLPGDPPPSMILTLHGASVEAASHLTHISGKTWAHLISPTNRGSFGFDWEDYGRKDALEALEDAQRRFSYDPTRVYLSGHSMGGHGTWHIGSLHPDRFAAIGPSAGWISYWSYRGHPPFSGDTPLDALLRRPMLASDTEKLLPNLKDRNVYVLHGNVDSNVPADQSREIAKLLEKFHRDWTYREEGGSHFWSSKESDSSTSCVDWPEMWQSFSRHVLPPAAAVRSIEFVTPNPRTTSRYHWLTIYAQQRHGELSRVKAECWPLKREFEIETNNVAVLRLDVRHLREGSVNVRLDGKAVIVKAPDPGGGIWFEHVAEEPPKLPPLVSAIGNVAHSGGLRLADLLDKVHSGRGIRDILDKASRGNETEIWRAIDPPNALAKGPHRYGPVKEEVDRRFVVVYGTGGTQSENICMLAKARYDAETFLSRGNCTAEMIPDSQFKPADFRDRTVMLVGNGDTNSAWTQMLAESPVQVKRGEIRVGERVYSGEDIAAMFVQPRRDSDVASVIAIAGTGPVGMQLTYRWNLFVPFMRYPDCLVSQAAMPDEDQPTTLAAGYFGRDWSVSQGEFVFAEKPAGD